MLKRDIADKKNKIKHQISTKAELENRISTANVRRANLNQSTTNLLAEKDKTTTEMQTYIHQQEQTRQEILNRISECTAKMDEFRKMADPIEARGMMIRLSQEIKECHLKIETAKKAENSNQLKEKTQQLVVQKMELVSILNNLQNQESQTGEEENEKMLVDMENDNQDIVNIQKIIEETQGEIERLTDKIKENETASCIHCTNSLFEE
ncbi:hypothetical protein BLNAU_19564 [Blattamonas nauphoetae]|uniref:Uncharacterized protein n=1 Tax=Blattamonas nauphoetae TaxID=2049346 RepID=A0ABQ9X4B8_9EUKA|nr:hypothetical protein BLNAU_19564 [Blattamonas nauphoetae]